MNINLTVNDNTRKTKSYIATMASMGSLTAVSGTWINTYTESISAEIGSFDSGNFYTWGSASAYNVVSSIYVKFAPATTTLLPHLCSFVISGAAVTISPSGFYTSSVNITATEWPSDIIFAPHFRVNYETTADGTSAIWRQLPPSFTPTISSVLFFNLSTFPPVSGFSIFNYPDNSYSISTQVSALSTHTDNSVTYTTTNGASTITHVASNIGFILDSQLFNYTKEKTMTLNFVDLIPTASFITYPSSAWNGTTWIDVSNNYTLSPGACAYGNGHTEVFNFSAVQASNPGDITYTWAVGPNTFSVLNDPTTAYSVDSTNPQTTTITIPVSLGVSTTGLPISMPAWHYDDSSGNYVLYPNFKITTIDNSNPLFQHLRMVPLPSTSQVTITSVNPGVVVLPFHDGFNTSLSAQFVNDSLLENLSGTYDWSLTNPGYWTVTHSNTSSFVSFDLAIGNQAVAGQINPNQLTQLTLSVVGNVSGTVVPGGGTWPIIQSQATDSETVSAFEFVTRVYLTDRYNVTGTNVVHQNASIYTPILSATFWNDGVSSVKLNGYSPYIAQYSVPATMDLTVSSVLAQDDTTITVSQDFSDVSVVIARFEPYNDNITRIYGAVNINLPVAMLDCKIPPNEWSEADNINRSLERLNTNFTYLKNAAQIYNPPPTELYGWFGEHTQVGRYWHVNIDNLDTDYNTLTAAQSAGFLSNVRDVITDSYDNIYLTNATTVYVLSADWQATERYRSTGGSNSFESPVALALNSSNRLYVLDKGRNEIVVLNDVNHVTPFTVHASWGGLGGSGSKDKYSGPTDIYISSGYLWVVDSGNRCIKKYTENGAWQKTITNTYFNESKPVSIASDLDGNIHVILENNNIIKMQADGTFITRYTYPKSLHATPKKIRPSADGGFLYICLAQSVIKINKDGVYAGIFANDIKGTLNYESIYQDEHRNTFLANGHSIVKYVDTITAKSLKLATNTYEWTFDDIKIGRDEFTENWVYNRAFARLWDNFELFRRSLIGKPSTISTAQSGINTLKILPFELGEYTSLPYSKNEIYIGVNEIVTADVINRCIERLYECEQTLINLIS